MRSFTKFFLVIIVAWFTSAIVVAQNASYGLTKQEQSDLQKYQLEQQKDPSTIVSLPLAPTGGRDVGDDCTNPIIVSIPADLTYSDIGQTNCGRGNNYDATCLGSYDGGEDIIYRLDVTTATTVNITMNPNGTTWSGMGILRMSGCRNLCTIHYRFRWWKQGAG